MNENIVAITKKKENAQIPTRATVGSAGFDLYACTDEAITISPQDLVMVPTGVAISLPCNEYVALIFARSGLGIKHGITLSNGVGVIDSDYRGEIAVGLCNVGKKPYKIENGDRIAQLVFMPLANLTLVEKNELNYTERSDSGFGSTGR